MKITVRTWASQKDLGAAQSQSTQVGEEVARVLQQAITGQGEHPGANLSGIDAQQLIDTIERTGGKRTAAEQQLLDFLRGPASDRRSKSYLKVGDSEVLLVGATTGKTGGRSILRNDELARLAASGNLRPVEIPRAELDARAARVLGGDAAVTAQPLDRSLASYLRSTGSAKQAGVLEAQQLVCRQAAASFLTGAVASWVENDMPVPPELVGKRFTVDDVVAPSAALKEFMSATHIEVHDQGEVTRYAEGGTELGDVVSFSLQCRGELASWRCFRDKEAGYFTTIAIRDGIMGPSRTEKLDRPQ